MLIDKYATPEFAPYTVALGQLALAWNELQHNLCELFSLVTLQELPKAGDMVNFAPTYVWHSIRSDRSQRDMLSAAIEHSKLGSSNELARDGKWLCDRVDELENRRNDIFHSPLIPWQRGKEHTEIIPNVFMKNPRAKQLAGAADLLEEIKSAANCALKLSNYAQWIIVALMGNSASWPDRPVLQGRKPKHTAIVQRSRHK
jgi:hypothetical protein